MLYWLRILNFKNRIIMHKNQKSLAFILSKVRREVIGQDPSAGKGGLWLETILGLALYLLPLLGLWLGMVNSVIAIILVILARAVGIIITGAVPMHTGMHGGFSSSRRLNYWAGNTIYLFGFSRTMWDIKHNFLHHTFTNILHHDPDVSAGEPTMRFSIFSKLRHRMLRYQHYYFVLLYALAFINWFLIGEYKMLSDYYKRGLGRFKNRETAKSEYHQTVLSVTVIKVVYLFATFGPILVGVPFLTCLYCWLGMMMLSSFVFTLIFQLAHVTEEVEMYSENHAKEQHYEHQLSTTANFTFYHPMLTRVMNRLIGGLNYQIEHHFWCNVSPRYYQRLSDQTKTVLASYGNKWKYKTRSFHKACLEHFRYLRKCAHHRKEISIDFG